MPEKVREAVARTQRADLSGAKAVGHNAYQSAGAMLTLCLSKHGELNTLTRAKRDANME